MNNSLFIVYTGNRFNQILIFPTYDAAANWIRHATRFTEEQITNAIKTPFDTKEGYLSVFEDA
jgi:hypothetical protein